MLLLVFLLRIEATATDFARGRVIKLEAGEEVNSWVEFGDDCLLDCEDADDEAGDGGVMSKRLWSQGG